VATPANNAGLHNQEWGGHIYIYIYICTGLRHLGGDVAATSALRLTSEMAALAACGFEACA